jgi:starvation-inducible DNA-binding protein
MEPLFEAMKKVLADTFVMYMKAHGYHWNVIGADFPQLHEFFGDLYEELHDAVDPIAEHLRSIDSFAPGTIQRMKELASIPEDDAIPNSGKMVTNLLAANQMVLTSLKEAFNIANGVGEDGLANFLQDRMDIHKKHNWMLKATAGMKS